MGSPGRAASAPPRSLARRIPGLAIAGIALLLLAAPVAAETPAGGDAPVVYKWVDEHGIAHYTTDRDRIPAEIRNRIEDRSSAGGRGSDWLTREAGEAPEPSPAAGVARQAPAAGPAPSAAAPPAAAPSGATAETGGQPSEPGGAPAEGGGETVHGYRQQPDWNEAPGGQAVYAPGDLGEAQGTSPDHAIGGVDTRDMNQEQQAPHSPPVPPVPPTRSQVAAVPPEPAAVPVEGEGAPLEATGAPVEAPAVPVPSAAEASGSSAEPAGSRASAAEPVGSTAEPAGSTAEPAGSTAEPAGSTAEPAGSTAEPAGPAAVASRAPLTPSKAAELAEIDRQIAELEKQIASDEDALMTLIGDTQDAKAKPDLYDDPKFREIAQRLPERQAQLEALRERRLRIEPPSARR